MRRRGGFAIQSPHAVVLGLWGLALAGCVSAPVNADRVAFAQTPSRNAIPPGVVTLRPAEMLLLDVRLDRQVAGNSCGAHAVASLVDYWQRAAPSAVQGGLTSGSEIYARMPPSGAAGYTLAEMVALIEAAGLSALAVHSTAEALKSELEAGRPAIVRVSLPAALVRPATIFPNETPLLAGVETRAFSLSTRMSGEGRLDHYWLVIGFDEERMVVLDPAMGIRSVSRDAFETAFDAGGRLAVVAGGWREP